MEVAEEWNIFSFLSRDVHVQYRSHTDMEASADVAEDTFIHVLLKPSFKINVRDASMHHSIKKKKISALTQVFCFYYWSSELEPIQTWDYYRVIWCGNGSRLYPLPLKIKARCCWVFVVFFGNIIGRQKHHYGRIWLWYFIVVWVTRCVMVCIVLHSLRGPKRRQWRFWPTTTTAERCTPSQVSICRLVRTHWLQIGHWHTDQMISLMGPNIFHFSVFNGAFLSDKALGFWFLKRSRVDSDPSISYSWVWSLSAAVNLP